VETIGIRSSFAGACAAAFLSAAVKSLVQPISLIIKVLITALITAKQGLSCRDSKTRHQGHLVVVLAFVSTF